MTHEPSFLPVVIAVFIAPPAWGQQVFERNVSKDEKPKPALAPRNAPIVIIRGANQAQITTSINGHYVTFEPPRMPASERKDGDDDLDGPPPAPVVQRVELKTAILERENFDRCLYGPGSSEEERHRKLDILLFWLVDSEAWKNRFTDQERAKLTLAGKGDIKRIFERVDAARRDFEDTRKSLATGWDSLIRLRPLTAELERGPFGEDSLFAKTLAKIERDRASKGPR